MMLRSALDDYLRLRRALGFKLHDHGQLLRDLVDDLERAEADHLTTEMAVAWASKSVGVQPFRWKARLSMVRGFAQYLHTLDPESQVPPSDLLAYRPSRRTPYLYSEDDIAGLLGATDTLHPPFRAATYRTLVALLAVTGLRVGEAFRLDCEDVNLEAGLLAVRETKFNKSRWVPLHPSTVDALSRYAGQRDDLFPRPKVPSFLVSTVGTRLLYPSVHPVFSDLVSRAGLDCRRTSGRPRIHDLRHSFAVSTLLAWYRVGSDVGARLPLLSAYLGHVNPSSTYWYLEAAPELLALAAERLENNSRALS